MGDCRSVARHLILLHVLQHHVDEEIKSPKRAHKLLGTLHDDPYFGADAAVDQL